jgi:hypothetical protein
MEILMKNPKSKKSSKSDIDDEEAIEHFKKRFLKKIPAKKRKKLYVVVGEKKYLVDEIVEHMKARDEIGKLELRIEKEFMKWLRKRGEE